MVNGVGIMKVKISDKKTKRLPKGQRIHARRVKQADRNDPTKLGMKN
jgi:hypothetical protein